MELDREPVALRSLVEESVGPGRRGRSHRRVRRRRCRPTWSCRPTRPGCASCSSTSSTTPGGTRRRAPPSASSGGADGDRWWLEVADDGGGVAPEDRERVFERFGTDGGGGTGLGLAVARWVAQLHGGTLRFLDPDVGTRRPAAPRGPAGTARGPSPARREPPRPPPAAPTDRVAAPAAARQRPQPELDAPLRRVLARGRACRRACAPSSRRPWPGSSPASPCRSPRSGITWTLVAVTCGVAALLTARRRREPWTLLCAGLALLLVLPMTLLDAWWVQMLGLRRRRRGVPVRRHRRPHAARHPPVRDVLAARVAARTAVVRPVAADRRHRVADAGARPHRRSGRCSGSASSARSSPAPTRSSGRGSTSWCPT